MKRFTLKGLQNVEVGYNWVTRPVKATLTVDEERGVVTLSWEHYPYTDGYEPEMETIKLKLAPTFKGMPKHYETEPVTPTYDEYFVTNSSNEKEHNQRVIFIGAYVPWANQQDKHEAIYLNCFAHSKTLHIRAQWLHRAYFCKANPIELRAESTMFELDEPSQAVWKELLDYARKYKL